MDMDQPANSTFKRILKEWIIPFGLEILVILLIIKFLFFFVIVPTGSMMPTIDEHSVLFATRVHDTGKLQRGNIVVFDSEELGKTMVKRLVGLPGEHVVIDEEGVVFIDDQPLEEDYVVYPSHLTGEFWVPEDCFLFLGDNRANSKDARMWEDPYIPGEKITGKAIFTLWPFANFGTLK